MLTVLISWILIITHEAIGMACYRDSKGEGRVPLRDQQSSLAMLLELAIQRGSLCHMVRAVLLLLELWREGGGCRHDRDNRLQQGAGGDRGLMSAPLLPFLRRIQDIPTAKNVNMSRWDEVSTAVFRSLAGLWLTVLPCVS